MGQDGVKMRGYLRLGKSERLQTTADRRMKEEMPSMLTDQMKMLAFTTESEDDFMTRMPPTLTLSYG